MIKMMAIAQKIIFSKNSAVPTAAIGQIIQSRTSIGPTITITISRKIANIIMINLTMAPITRLIRLKAKVWMATPRSKPSFCRGVTSLLQGEKRVLRSCGTGKRYKKLNFKKLIQTRKRSTGALIKCQITYLKITIPKILSDTRSNSKQFF